MKIGAIGINAYQEMAVRPQAAQKAPTPAEAEQTSKPEQVHIPGQIGKVGSEISIKLGSGDYASMLSTEEKQALELLFEKFGDKKGIIDANSTGRPELGKFVDVKL